MSNRKVINLRTDFSNVKIDFSEVRNLDFHCVEQCGKCCFFQAPLITSTEIHEILANISKKSYHELSDFALDYYTFNNSLVNFNSESIKHYAESLKWFWAPFQLDEAEDCVLVRNYAVYSMPSSGRCALLDPIDMKCLAYESRPVTCRIYPFSHEANASDVWKIIKAMENCPGLKSGILSIDEKGLEQVILKNLKDFIKDAQAYEKYIEENQIKLLSRVKSDNIGHNAEKPQDIAKTLRKFERDWQKAYYQHKGNERFEKALKKGVKFIEPLAERGLIPHSPLIAAYNKNRNNR
jgi:Fe-S-cluster containining protein